MHTLFQVLSVAAYLACSALFTVNALPASSKIKPLVLWHGLGDSHSSPGMLEFAEMIKEVHPGIFVHSIYIEEDLSADRRAGFYGNVNEQLEQVAQQLESVEELRGGFDAIGFSQGGQFLRAYVERYNSPPIRNLITFGSQHMGVSDIPTCRPGDFLCQITRRAIKNGVYSTWAQNNLIQAQYFRDPSQLDTYLEANHFLPSINNEVPGNRNKTYADNLSTLDKLVLVLFSKDKTVVPKESAWFGSEAVDDDITEDNSNSGQHTLANTPPTTIIPMRLQPLYTEDWIGLKALDQRGDVVLETCDGEHMQLGDCWKGLVKRFVGDAP
ncbi:palmitoyl-protein thioesterase [Athelia psychrophila]|uniref:Palmitoyl-protein thioesterase 1 n=1 Tax=Athelia psychrophila TaxID=1759441 RepID=A0A166WZ09_9AGAM|nr:palmitoyl-protein thioesterase [Fibularhizoctonia sp. CBS 109695]